MVGAARVDKKGSCKELIKQKVEGARRVLDATKLRSVLDIHKATVGPAIVKNSHNTSHMSS